MAEQSSSFEVPHRSQPTNVLVTGGSGLVGSNVIQQLLKKGFIVSAIYRDKIPAISNHQKVTWIKGDILDIIALTEAMQNIEKVYHCAAIVSFNPKKKNELFKTNLEGTANVVNAALMAGVKKLCYVSSVAALGKNKTGEISEKTAWSDESNHSNYGKSKYLAELEVWRGIGEGLQAVIVNPAIILGAGDWNDGSTKIFKSAYEEFPWYTKGVTGFVDVKDVATAMILLMESNISGEKFLLSAESLPYREVFTLISKAFGRKAPHKKAGSFASGLVWRIEAIKSTFSNEEPLITKETAQAAQSIVMFDNNKMKQYLPSFTYTTIKESIVRICMELKEKYNLE